MKESPAKILTSASSLPALVILNVIKLLESRFVILAYFTKSSSNTLPSGTEACVEYNVTSELREYSIEMTYHFRDPNIRKPALDHIFRQVSRVEALIHDNTAVDLSDSSNLFNINLSSCDLDVGDSDSEYVVSWDLSCQHLANIG